MLNESTMQDLHKKVDGVLRFINFNKHFKNIRPELSGVYIKNGLMVATDSYMLIEFNCKSIHVADHLEVILDGSELKALIKGRKFEKLTVLDHIEDNKVEISFDDNKKVFTLSILDGDRYPEYKILFNNLKSKDSAYKSGVYDSTLMGNIVKFFHKDLFEMRQYDCNLYFENVANHPSRNQYYARCLLMGVRW